MPIVVLTAKDMTPRDRARLEGRISLLAAKGTLRQAELVELVERVAGRGAASAGTAP